MYLTKLQLNNRSREVQRDLGNAHRLHQRIMQAFPDEERQQARADWSVLFRQEPDSEVILVQSAIAGDWSYLPDQYVAETVESRSFDPNPQRFSPGRGFRFRLRANPSRRDNQSRKLIGLYRREDQLEWLTRQGDRHGFALEAVDAIPSPNVWGQKGKAMAPIRISTVLFQGVLRVTEPENLLQAMRTGIGRGRSYGCGLLSLAACG